MAFESLTDKFGKIFKKLKGQSHISETDVDESLKEVKIALLEADVNYKVAKDFVNDIKTKIVGQEIFGKLNASETVIKIVKDDLTELLGSANSELRFAKNGLTSIMLVGLQGSGKTTTAAKLANLMNKKLNKKVMLVACDVYRPAAIDQLKQLAQQINVEFYSEDDNKNPVDISNNAKTKAYNEQFDVVIIDTAGRLQIDEELMDELLNIKNKILPNEILLLTDAMAGQDSVNVANSFNDKLGITGVVMSKMDGDSRGGAALSIKKMTNVPIKYIGVGEKIDDLDIFYPERMAERILGMGDIMSLIDKVSENIDQKEASKAMRKMEDGNFTLNDMLKQMKQVQKLGSLGGLLKLMPGMPKLSEQQLSVAEKEMKNFEIIINSMTPYERSNPEILKNSRKIRIARGSGKNTSDVNRVLKKYEQSKMMMKQMKNYKKGGKLPPGFSGF